MALILEIGKHYKDGNGKVFRISEYREGYTKPYIGILQGCDPSDFRSVQAFYVDGQWSREYFDMRNSDNNTTKYDPIHDLVEEVIVEDSKEEVSV